MLRQCNFHKKLLIFCMIFQTRLTDILQTITCFLPTKDKNFTYLCHNIFDNNKLPGICTELFTTVLMAILLTVTVRLHWPENPGLII